MSDQAKERMQHLLMLQRHRHKRGDFLAALAANGVEWLNRFPS